MEQAFPDDPILLRTVSPTGKGIRLMHYKYLLEQVPCTGKEKG